MVYNYNDSTNILKHNSVSQEEINIELKEIYESLKLIPEFGTIYMEYLSALIYSIYENIDLFKDIILVNARSIEEIVRLIDKKVNDIREQEKSRKLFMNISFEGRFTSKNGTSLRQVLIKLTKLILDIKSKNAKAKLGEAFEYVIMLAEKDKNIPYSNKEFYTPKGVVKTMVNMLNIFPESSIYNPACGTGNFITESAKKGNIYVFGETKNLGNFNICITNLWLHDIFNKRIKENDEEITPQVDFAISNPPFVSKKINEDHYNLASHKDSYLNYLSKMINTVNNYGKVSIILPQGFLFKKTKFDTYVRSKLVKDGMIDAIVALPEKIFFGSKIPAVILMIDKGKRNKNILFIDASNEYESMRKTNILTEENQKKIVDTYRKRETIQNYSYLAKLEEIEKNDFDLSIKRYIKIKNEIKQINKEEVEEKIFELERKRKEIQEEIQRLLK